MFAICQIYQNDHDIKGYGLWDLTFIESDLFLYLSVCVGVF